MSASIVQAGIRPIQFWEERTINEGTDDEYVKLEILYGDFLLFLQANGFGLLVTGFVPVFPALLCVLYLLV